MQGSLLEENFLQPLIEKLNTLVADLKKAATVQKKLQILNNDSQVRDFLKKVGPVTSFLKGVSPESELIIKSILAIGQGARVFDASGSLSTTSAKLEELVQLLLPVEQFYSEMGGLVGYHLMILKLLVHQEDKVEEHQQSYHRPEGFDISSEDADVRGAVLWGLKKMSEMAEIYPLGGAADRLRLQDEKTGVPLPAARLHFLGKTLLEGMISDLQAREYLHYKLFGKQLVTPVAIMTSKEKDNHKHILSICEEMGWFARPQESFFLFCQPSVPTIDRDGNWCLLGSLKLLLKPGGHGVIWKLARDAGVFEWLFSKGITKTLVRQINNPIAAVDYGLLAFTGIGFKYDKVFGFASCRRLMKASEGINLLIKKEKESGHEYLLTNVEYCDFKKFNIVDQPEKEGSLYSKFSSNTNILFADLKAVLNALEECPIPGMLINIKKTAFRDEEGQVKEADIGRLESMMQNIADSFRKVAPQPLAAEEQFYLPAYLTYNSREKTISTVKREFVLGASLLETPEGCYLDILQNVRELLVDYCGMQVPDVNGPTHFFVHGPSFVFLYHPALGPLYSIIAQKLRGGKMARGSEMQLEIAEIDCEGIDIDGSLCVRAEAIMGDKDVDRILKYSEKTGKCVLKNVKVRNQGIDREAPNVFWRNEIFRKELCQISIEGDGEFYAENVTLSGNLYIAVEAGTRVTARERNGELIFHTESITAPTWHWKYTADDTHAIQLTKQPRS